MTIWLLAIILILIAVLGRRSNELFLVSIRRERIIVVRGHVPPALLDAFAAIAASSRIESATVRAIRRPEHARLIAGGVDAATTQRLRNVFGIHPMHELRAVPTMDGLNLRQLLGWAWLAWRLLRR